MQKYSSRREAVAEALMNTRSHPSAAEVYDMVRVGYPSISLSTVYRNLSQFAGSGKALLITDPDGVMHFDGYTHPHNHLYCRVCRRVFDVDIPVTAEVPDDCTHLIEGYTVLFSGICENCK